MLTVAYGSDGKRIHIDEYDKSKEKNWVKIFNKNKDKINDIIERLNQSLKFLSKFILVFL